MEKSPFRTMLEIVNHVAGQHPSLRQEISKILNANTFEFDRTFLDWKNRGYAAPAPQAVKLQVLLRNNLPNSTWVETGTYLGDTCEFLSKVATRVYSTEPGPELYKKAVERFQQVPNVHIHNEISETFLPALLPTLSGNVCFWLDGHYSAGVTFAGPNDTPLREELKALKASLRKFDNVAVLVDDIRYCGKHHQYGSYPSLGELVAFADSCDLEWYVEHDIFVAKTKMSLI
jgi:hypothetical protein